MDELFDAEQDNKAKVFVDCFVTAIEAHIELDEGLLELIENKNTEEIAKIAIALAECLLVRATGAEGKLVLTATRVALAEDIPFAQA